MSQLLPCQKRHLTLRICWRIPLARLAPIYLTRDGQQSRKESATNYAGSESIVICTGSLRTGSCAHILAVVLVTEMGVVLPAGVHHMVYFTYHNQRF